MTSENWKPKKLNELGFVGRGKSRHRPRNVPELYGGKYPFIQTANIMASELYINSYSQTYSEMGLAQSKMWKKGTLCMTIAGENTAETAILGMDACFPDSVVGFVADPEVSDVRFVKYYLDTMKSSFKSVSRGATQDNLSIDKLLSFDLIVPDVITQRKIADVLSAYDDLIVVNTRRIRILEQMAQSSYREWFGKVDAQSLPEGWEIVKVGERFKTVLGGTPSRAKGEYWQNGTIPWINSSKCNLLRIIEPSEYITELGLNNSSTKLMPKRTTVIAITGATLGQLSLTEIATCANQSIVGVWDDENIYTEYIYLTFRELIQEVIQHAGGAAQQHINKEIVNAVQIALPPRELVTNFQKIVKPMFDLLANMIWKNANLRRTRDLLLPRLVSGEIELANE